MSYYNTLTTLDFDFCVLLRMPLTHRSKLLTTSSPTAHRREDHISLIVDLLEEDMLSEALICRAIGNAHSPRQGQHTHRRVPQSEVSDFFDLCSLVARRFQGWSAL
jgi:hypothetical protein